MIRSSAPAKINLVFQVGESIEGYHEVNSLYLGLDIFEELTLSQAELGSGFQIDIKTEYLPERHLKAVPRDRSNLVYKVAETMFNNVGLDMPDLLVSIDKRIPVAGGLAGGSADAAAMMLAVNELLHRNYGIIKLTKNELVTLAKEFGSDAPFSLIGGLAIGSGRGDEKER